MNYNQEAKSLTFRRGSEVSQALGVCAGGLQGFRASGFYGHQAFSNLGFIAEARKLEHGFRRISARIPYTLP